MSEKPISPLTTASVIPFQPMLDSDRFFYNCFGL